VHNTASHNSNNASALRSRQPWNSSRNQAKSFRADCSPSPCTAGTLPPTAVVLLRVLDKHEECRQRPPTSRGHAVTTRAPGRRTPAQVKDQV
jgi:hypothetical protein